MSLILGRTHRPLAVWNGVGLLSGHGQIAGLDVNRVVTRLTSGAHCASVPPQPIGPSNSTVVKPQQASSPAEQGGLGPC